MPRDQMLEVQEVRLRVLRLVFAVPCKQIPENLHGLIEKLRIFYMCPRIEPFLMTLKGKHVKKTSGFSKASF